MVSLNSYPSPDFDGPHSRRDELYSLALLAGGVGIWEWHPATGVFMVHPQLLTMLGDDTGNLVFGIDDWLQRVHPQDRPKVQAALTGLRHPERQLYEHCHRVRHRDGNYRVVLSRAVVAARNDRLPTRVVGVDIDMSRPRPTSS